jgi:hypothetical protein
VADGELFDNTIGLEFRAGIFTEEFGTGGAALVKRDLVRASEDGNGTDVQEQIYTGFGGGLSDAASSLHIDSSVYRRILLPHRIDVGQMYHTPATLDCATHRLPVRHISLHKLDAQLL